MATNNDSYDINIFDEVIRETSIPLSDIFQKLLPFTQKTKNGIEFSLWNLSTGDIIITTIELLLITLFVFYTFKLFSFFKKDKLTIKSIKSSIHLYKNNIDLICKTNKQQKLKSTWVNFSNSLINNAKQSLSADIFFNETLLMNSRYQKFFSALPGMLLSIGLLGTFFALYVALIELDLNDANIKESIKNFIGLIGIKFTASIWGIFLSTTFHYLYKKIEQQSHNELLEIQTLINNTFPIQRPEESLCQLVLENKKQTQLLENLIKKYDT